MMFEKTNPLPPVFFNHLYVVLDDKTYHAIQGSDFLQVAFPGKEKRATLTAAGETWSGTYFYCQDNYLEFFGSGNGPVTGEATRGGHWQSGAQEGWAGLAFSADQPGGVAAVYQALQKSFGYEPFHELRQMNAGEKIINWFYQVRLAELLGLGSFEAWVMEYHPDVFAYKGIPLPENGKLTRLAYLSSWNKDRIPAKESVERQIVEETTSTKASDGSNDEPQDTHFPDARKTESGSRTPARSTPRVLALRPEAPRPPVFSRVTGVTLHLDHLRAERFANVLGILGYAKEEKNNGLELSAHGFTLRILPEEAGPRGYRLSALRLAMSRPSVAPMTFVFAPGSRLVLNDDLTADWEFGL
jgi:hypothetical protein